MGGRTERDTLNGLIEICRDGARGFRLAADHVRAPELKQVFTDTASQRELFAAELVRYAQRLGGGSDGEGTARGSLHRGWMMVKDAMMNYDEKAILAEAIRGEAAAVNVYAEAVRDMLPPGARGVIEAQYEKIRDAQRELDALTFARQ